jgi:hypothetical protein
MSEAERQLADTRVSRNAARRLFDSRFARIRNEVEAHGGIVGKVKDEAGRTALDAADQGLAIARESKGIVAATVAALGLWFFRAPLIEAVKSRFFKDGKQAGVQED